MPIVGGKYVSPDWRDDTSPALDAQNMTELCKTVEDHDKLQPLETTGGTMTSYLENVNGQVRNIFVSSREPTAADGNDGDLWFQYEE